MLDLDLGLEKETKITITSGIGIILLTLWTIVQTSLIWYIFLGIEVLLICLLDPSIIKIATGVEMEWSEA
jgi:hypothetical protein